jgi:hypothetical protein
LDCDSAVRRTTVFAEAESLFFSCRHKVMRKSGVLSGRISLFTADCRSSGNYRRRGGSQLFLPTPRIWLSSVWSPMRVLNNSLQPASIRGRALAVPQHSGYRVDTQFLRT